MTVVTRQHFAATLAAAATGSQLGRPSAGAVFLGPIRSITPPEHGYAGWPTVARRRNGELIVVWSGDREAHVCPFGRVNMAISRDGGESWTWPRVLLDSDLDDRDAGVVETPRGSLLVTTFTSLAYEQILERERAAWPREKVARWESVHNRRDARSRKAQLGSWMLRSADDGVTWTAPYRIQLNSPHGPSALSDGGLIYAGKELYGGSGRIGVCVSKDDGVSWSWLANIPTRPGDDPGQYHELHQVEGSGGRIIVQIRNHGAQNERETLQTESVDGGRSWSIPHAIGVWGLPSHLLRLADDRLLMTYGYRRTPYGNQARVSTDAGRSWSEPMTLSSDGASGDLGYPSTVQLGDGSLLTVWYERRPGVAAAVMRQLRWRLES